MSAQVLRKFSDPDLNKAIEGAYQQLLEAADSEARHQACRELERLVKERHDHERASK